MVLRGERGGNAPDPLGPSVKEEDGQLDYNRSRNPSRNRTHPFQLRFQCGVKFSAVASTVRPRQETP